MHSHITDATKKMLLSHVSKKVGTHIGNWVQTTYPNIQRQCCPWCHVKEVELHRCHVGPRKVDIIRTEMDSLWSLSTAMGQTPSMDTFVQRVTERVKQDHVDGLTRIEIACGVCNPYFENMKLSKLEELNHMSARDRRTMWNMYKKHVDNPNPTKKRRVESAITKYFCPGGAVDKSGQSESEEYDAFSDGPATYWTGDTVSKWLSSDMVFTRDDANVLDVYKNANMVRADAKDALANYKTFCKKKGYPALLSIKKGLARMGYTRGAVNGKRYFSGIVLNQQYQNDKRSRDECREESDGFESDQSETSDSTSKQEEEEERKSNINSICERYGRKLSKCASMDKHEQLIVEVSQQKYMPTKTLKEIYLVILGKSAMGAYANNRTWLRSTVERFIKN